MKTYDIVCEADGWACFVDGVYLDSFPSWLLALNAASRAAEQDARDGLSTTLRYQGLDGQMLPLQSCEVGKPPFERAHTAAMLPARQPALF
jgi:hypothetical protein